jgi:hypothetical protein
MKFSDTILLLGGFAFMVVVLYLYQSLGAGALQVAFSSGG